MRSGFNPWIYDHDVVDDGGVYVDVLTFSSIAIAREGRCVQSQLLQAYTANLEPRRAFTSLVFLCRNMQNTIIHTKAEAS